MRHTLRTARLTHTRALRWVIASLGRRKPGVSLRLGFVDMRGLLSDDYDMREHEYTPPVVACPGDEALFS